MNKNKFRKHLEDLGFNRKSKKNTGVFTYDGGGDWTLFLVERRDSNGDTSYKFSYDHKSKIFEYWREELEVWFPVENALDIPTMIALYK